MKDDTVSVLRGGTALWNTVRTRGADEELYFFGGEVFDGRFKGKLTIIEIEDEQGRAQKIILAPVSACPDDWAPAESFCDDPWELPELAHLNLAESGMCVIGFRTALRDANEHDETLH